jgi:hypothetical protein
MSASGPDCPLWPQAVRAEMTDAGSHTGSWPICRLAWLLCTGTHVWLVHIWLYHSSRGKVLCRWCWGLGAPSALPPWRPLVVGNHSHWCSVSQACVWASCAEYEKVCVQWLPWWCAPVISWNELVPGNASWRRMWLAVASRYQGWMPIRKKSLVVKGPLSTPVVGSRQVTHPWAFVSGGCQHHGHRLLAMYKPYSTANLWRLGLVTCL